MDNLPALGNAGFYICCCLFPNACMGGRTSYHAMAYSVDFGFHENDGFRVFPRNWLSD